MQETEKKQDRYKNMFARMKKLKRRAFIPYTMLGYPNYEKSLAAIKCMIDHGAAALELGLAFSDPLADGPLIQNAAALTLASGFTTEAAFALLEEIRALNSDIPICMMTYYNPVLAWGLSRFCQRAARAGADGLLVVDLPVEEARDLSACCKEYGLDQVFIVSPLTTETRLREIAVLGSGFLYAVSRLGLTGLEETYDRQLAELIKTAKEVSQTPLAVGFGVSSCQQARKMYELGADAVICGSKIIELINKNSIELLADFVKEMTDADLASQAS